LSAISIIPKIDQLRLSSTQGRVKICDRLPRKPGFMDWRINPTAQSAGSGPNCL